MSSLKLRGLRKAYGAVEVIKGVDLDIEAREFVVFVGPSGCGKSTLLRMIAGLETITGGSLEIGGKQMNDVDPSQRGVAMVFQTYALYPHLTVRENMGFALKFAKMSKAEIAAQVLEAARILELEPLLDRRPKDLSGGQRQRVAIGRAIVRHPQVFLFDEPLSNLDAELRVHMRIELARLHRELKTTMIYVTHDQVEAMTLADRIVVLRAGVVEQVGTPLELYDDPANQFVAGFIGSPKMNLLEGVVDGANLRLTRHGDQLVPLGALAARVSAGEVITAGIRPEHFKRGGSAVLTVMTEIVEQLGGETYAYARAGTGDVMTIAVEDGRDLDGGVAIAARYDPAKVLFFNAKGERLR
ncbi:MAG: sn-glycerol-3-phosphate ABC transporter ATP-binding protein UgpC [Deltaproteobacteria bacterium]